ncbi:nuclear protein 96-domain-containing protein [Spinellus fusiger]|nr:nuclear protein 96-domain-containing protein [Spinellus fusiger]
MALIYKCTHIEEIPSQCPLATLHSTLQLSSFLELPNFATLSTEEKKLWEIFALLFSPRPSTELVLEFQAWLCTYTSMNEAVTHYKTKHDDLWAEAWIGISYGSISYAYEMAHASKDYALAILLTIPENQNIKIIARDQIKHWQDTRHFEKMSRCHQKVWYALSGQLGYCAYNAMIVTEDLSWECVLGLYVWSGTCGKQSLANAIQLYNQALAPPHGVHDLLAWKNTAKPPSECFWVGLLRLWTSHSTMLATGSRQERRSVKMETIRMDAWPIRFVWLFSLLKSSWFSVNTVEEATWKWCNELHTVGAIDKSVHAALFIESHHGRESFVRSILRKFEWRNEDYLHKSLKMPLLWIQEAKAVYAHSTKEYATEADYYFKMDEFDKAKHAILCYLVPTTLLHDQSDQALAYLKKLDQPDQPDTEGCILRTTFAALQTLPEQVRNALNHPSHREELRKEVDSMIDQLKGIKDRFPGASLLATLINRLCGRLLGLSARFHDHLHLGQLWETAPLPHKEGQDPVKHFSQCFLKSFTHRIQQHEKILLKAQPAFDL